jgi:hypothetical protein
MNDYKKEIIDQIIFKIVGLIDYNNTKLKSLNIIDLNYYININELNTLNLNNNLNEFNNLILEDYNLFKEYKESILQNNLEINIQKMIEKDIIFINLTIINNLFIELLDILVKKN